MSQCVPSWELDDNLAPFNFTFSNSSNSFTTTDTPSLDYEVTELTWENGQLAMHGLAPPRVVNKVGGATATPTTWDKPRAGGTLESIVNQATREAHPKSAVSAANELVPWFNHHHAFVNPAKSATMTMDALVPCNNVNSGIRRKDINVHENSSSHVLDSVPGVGTCMVGSCSAASTGAAAGRFAPVVPCRCRANPAVSESATCGTGGDSRQMTLDSGEREIGGGGGGGMTSTSLWSPENTSSGKEETKTSGDDHDSICYSRPQKREAGEKSKRKGSGKSSISAKSRAAAIHNQSERKRRDKINQRMKTLQKLVPNSSKTDKASMLDEVIEYLKQLQAQVQMMGRMNMMMPFMQQQLQMNMMAQAMGMGTMGVMDMNTIGRAAMMPPVVPMTATSAAGYMPMASWDIHGAADSMHVHPIMPDVLSTLLANQSQPMTVDGYSKLAALYQQFQQPGSGSKD